MIKGGKCNYMIWQFIQPVVWLKDTSRILLDHLHSLGVFIVVPLLVRCLCMWAVTFISTAAGKLRVNFHGNNDPSPGNISLRSNIYLFSPSAIFHVHVIKMKVWKYIVIYIINI